MFCEDQSDEIFGVSPMLVQIDYFRMVNVLQFYDMCDYCVPRKPYDELEYRGLLRGF